MTIGKPTVLTADKIFSSIGILLSGLESPSTASLGSEGAIIKADD